MGEIVSFDGARSRVSVQGSTTQRRGYKDDPRGYNRLALLRQFARGKGIRSIGRVHPQGEAGAENDLRAALVGILPGAKRKAA